MEKNVSEARVCRSNQREQGWGSVGLGSKGFQVVPRRWVVERTFAWICKFRRLSKDYEYLTETSESFIYAAMINVMLRRLAR